MARVRALGSPSDGDAACSGHGGVTAYAQPNPLALMDLESWAVTCADGRACHGSPDQTMECAEVTGSFAFPTIDPTGTPCTQAGGAAGLEDSTGACVDPGPICHQKGYEGGWDPVQKACLTVQPPVLPPPIQLTATGVHLQVVPPKTPGTQGTPGTPPGTPAPTAPSPSRWPVYVAAGVGVLVLGGAVMYASRKKP